MEVDACRYKFKYVLRFNKYIDKIVYVTTCSISTKDSKFFTYRFWEDCRFFLLE